MTSKFYNAILVAVIGFILFFAVAGITTYANAQECLEPTEVAATFKSGGVLFRVYETAPVSEPKNNRYFDIQKFWDTLVEDGVLPKSTEFDYNRLDFWGNGINPDYFVVMYVKNETTGQMCYVKHFTDSVKKMDAYHKHVYGENS